MLLKIILINKWLFSDLFDYSVKKTILVYFLIIINVTINGGRCKQLGIKPRQGNLFFNVHTGWGIIFKKCPFAHPCFPVEITRMWWLCIA